MLRRYPRLGRPSTGIKQCESTSKNRVFFEPVSVISFMGTLMEVGVGAKEACGRVVSDCPSRLF